MNLSSLASIFRHWITAGIGVLGLWLVSFLVLTGDEAKQLSGALAQMVEPLIIIVGLVIVAASRLALAWAGKIFRKESVDIGDEASGVNSVGGTMPLLLVCAAVGLGGALPSCSPRAYPVEGRVCYSSQSGLSVDVRAAK